MSMLGKRSTGSRVSATHPRASVISDIIRMKMGLRSASRVSHMASLLRGGGGSGLAGERVGPAHGADRRPVGQGVGAGGDDLVPGLQALGDLEPVPAVDPD